jgi:zinc transport system permease protein
MTLFDYLSMPFVWYAIIVGMLTALCAGLVGVPLVLKRYSMMGMGLSNVAFAGLAMGAIIGLVDELIIVLPLTILVAVLLLTSCNSKVKGDATIAMIAVGTLAFGYFLLNTFPVSSNLAGDVCSALFGSTQILALRTVDIWVSVTMAVLVIVFFVLFYNKIFATSFDPDFVKATGTKVKIYEILVAVVIAIVVSLSMRLVGPLLTAALIIFPALSAMRVFKDFKMVVIVSAVIAVVCSAFGMITAIMWDGAPVGATIVLANIVVFGVFYVVGFVLGRKGV